MSKEWEESLKQSRKEIDTGNTVPIEPVIERLKQTLKRMLAKRL